MKSKQQAVLNLDIFDLSMKVYAHQSRNIILDHYKPIELRLYFLDIKY